MRRTREQRVSLYPHFNAFAPRFFGSSSLGLPFLSQKRRRRGLLSLSFPERSNKTEEETQEAENRDDEEEDEDDDFQLSEESENEMETEMLDYI